MGLRVSMVQRMLARVAVCIARCPNIRARLWIELLKSCHGGVGAAAHFMLLNRVCTVWNFRAPNRPPKRGRRRLAPNATSTSELVAFG